VGIDNVPLSFSIDEGQQMLVVVGHGDVTIDDAFRVSDEIRLAPTWNPQMKTLADLRKARIVGKTHALWRLATRSHELAPGRARPTLGALVTGDLVVFGVARMYSLLASNEGVEFRVFKNVEDARRFLGLPSNGDDATAFGGGQ
jgi:hypothetical protein